MVAHKCFQILEIGLSVSHCFFRKVDWLAVVLSRKEETKHLPIKSFKGIVYGDKVAQGLRHLDIVDIDKAIVHPVVSEVLPVLASDWAISLVWCGNSRSGSTTVNINGIS